jgi:PKD repeat protein
VINTFSIDQYKPVSANFRFTALGKFAPDVMFFANRSTGVYDACKWDFGDGTTSNKCKIRAHIFPGAGVYRVTLTVSGPAGTTSLTRVINTDNPRMPEIQIFLPIVSDQDPDDK